MSANVLTPAILQYIDKGAYPDAEDTASAKLTSDALQTLLQELHKAQDAAKDEIRSLSQSTAPDIDNWISQAQALQTDILRSRDTARAIVAEAEAGKELKAKVEDAGKKVGLLEKEVAFNSSLTGTLEQVKIANGKLEQVQQETVRGNVEGALEKLQEAEGSIGALYGMRDTRAAGLLESRASGLRDGFKETATEYWNALIIVDAAAGSIRVKAEGSKAEVPEMRLDNVIQATQGLGIFESLVQKFARDVERTILRPRLMVDDEGQVAKVRINEGELFCTGKSSDASYATLFQDLETIFDFLAKNIPSSITIPLSAGLIPYLSTRLEEHWLEPAVPLGVDEMPAFQETLSHVQHFVDQIDKHDGWQGSKQLRDWVQNAPRTWLTKRREAVLGEVRQLVFAGLRETKVVERVETQMVRHDDHELGAVSGGIGAAEVQKGEGENGEDEAWDTAWDEQESEEAKPAEPEAPAKNNVGDDEDDASAWDVDDSEDKTEEPPGGGGEDEGEAWGWGDDQAASPAATSKQPAPTPPSKTNGTAAPPAEREMTLRETFTTTFIPDTLLSILQSLIADAQTLAGASYASSPIAPAASGLYTLPTLALAIYRATAPTAYTKAPSGNGNMLLYNDCSHLASQLRAWQASQPPASRLRLDGDAKALEVFAKRAYSAEMESQRTILRDLLDGAQGFSNCTAPLFKEACESAVQQVVERLRGDVYEQWKGVLSEGALRQSLGSLLATVTGKMITEIQDLPDIGEADSHQLRKLCDKVSELRDLFVQSPSGGSGEGEGHDMTFIYCPNWLKFQYLGEILESSLADIKYLWNEGELSLEFEAEEVVELIEALFAESDLRRRAVAEIRRSRR